MAKIESIEKKDAREIKNQLEVVRSYQPTYLVVLAIHKSNTLNVIRKIPIKKGIPINGYVKDLTAESYLVYCSDILILGLVDISFRLTTPDHSWEMPLPMPEAVARRYLSENQKIDLKRWEARFSGSDYYFEFFQMLSPN